MDDDHLRLFLTPEQFQQVKDARENIKRSHDFYFGLGMVSAVSGVWLAWLMVAVFFDRSPGAGIAFGSFWLGVYYLWKGWPGVYGRSE